MNWVLQFRELAEDAFQGKALYSWLLGNLLVMESYVQTLRQGLAAKGKQPAVMVSDTLERLWDCLEGRTTPMDCQDFANNLCPSNRAKDVEKAMELVHQTPVFRQLVGLIQGALKTALTATSV